MLFKIKSIKHQGKISILLNAPNVLKNIVFKILTLTKLKLGLIPKTLCFEDLMQYFYELKVNPFDIMNVVFWGGVVLLLIFLI